MCSRVSDTGRQRSQHEWSSDVVVLCSLHTRCHDVILGILCGRLLHSYEVLAGAVYSMTVVPCASTLCVVNIRQTEARVETVLSEFIQLGHEATQNTTQVGLPPSWLRSYQRELLPALHITSMLFHFWPVYKILSASISSAHCYWWGCRVTTSCVHS